MKSLKIFATCIACPVLGMISYANADFDCSTINKDEIKILFEKQESGTSLTTDELLTLKNAVSCKPVEGSGSTLKDRKMRFGSGQTLQDTTGSGMILKNNKMRFGSGTLTNEQKIQMETVNKLKEKQKNGETLSSDEQAILDSHKANIKNKANTNTKQQNSQQVKLSNTYQKAIDTKVEKMLGDYTGTEEKKSALIGFQTKINTLKGNLNGLNISDSKKETYNNIIDYLLQKISDTLSELNTDNDTNALIDEILN